MRLAFARHLIPLRQSCFFVELIEETATTNALYALTTGRRRSLCWTVPLNLADIRGPTSKPACHELPHRPRLRQGHATSSLARSSG